MIQSQTCRIVYLKSVWSLRRQICARHCYALRGNASPIVKKRSIGRHGTHQCIDTSYIKKKITLQKHKAWPSFRCEWICSKETNFHVFLPSRNWMQISDRCNNIKTTCCFLMHSKGCLWKPDATIQSRFVNAVHKHVSSVNIPQLLFWR